MIHRVDRILPDIDDRLIPANAGRGGSNMRLAASIANTDLAMTLVNGMAQIDYDIPAGDNLVVGATDKGNEGVFFALWNSNDDHSIYRILAGTIALVIRTSLLGFTETGEVDLRVIDGKLYWTNDDSQPGMVNIAKGIAGDYPDPIEEWMITQIKRPPGLLLELSPTDFTFEEASIDYDNDFPVPTPLQFSYYYVYDNDEESRFGPWSPCTWFRTGVSITIPAAEFDTYLDGINVVKQVVFVYRIGNDGIPYTVKRVNNASPFDGSLTIANVATLARSAVSADITDADFDAVPLKAKTLEVAQNRLNLANYLIDYPNWDGLTLELELVQNAFSSESTGDGANRVFMYGDYDVGVVLLDEWQRRIGVVASQRITIPSPVYQSIPYNVDGGAPTGEPPLVPAFFNEDGSYFYNIDFTLSGTFPSWAKYYQIVYSKSQSYNYFYKTVCRLYFWYTYNGQDFLVNSPYFQYDGSTFDPIADTVPLASLISSPTQGVVYSFRGYALELSSGEPFLFDSTGDQYLAISQEYFPAGLDLPESEFPPATNVNPVEYKIEKASGNLLFINQNPAQQLYAAFQSPDAPVGIFTGQYPFSLYYQVYLYSKKTAPDERFYQNTNAVLIADNVLTGTVYGDCYGARFKKLNNGGGQSVLNTQLLVSGATPYQVVVANADGNSLRSYATFPYTIQGYAVSMNPTNIYAQNWDSDIGQANVVNENQRQSRILQGIVFSNPLVQGTQINGLSKFNSVDNRQAPLENGPITALVRTSATQREPGVLLAIGTNGVSSFYYDGIQLTNVDGTSNVSTSDKYLASQRPLVGNYGAERISDIYATPLGTVYYWSSGIQDWIRYSNAGLDQLGEIYGFMNFVRNGLASSTKVMMTYDQTTDEAILIGNNSVAYVFSERYKTFQPVRDYQQGVDNISPEYGASIANRTFFFIQGQVWEMGPGVTADNNSFFGEVKNPQLSVVTNEGPAIVKQWNSIKVLGPRPLTCQVNNGGGETPVIQSYIDEGWWIERKAGEWSAAIRKDENSVGGVLNGNPMESRILISSFAWDANNFDKLNYIEVKSNISPVQ